MPIICTHRQQQCAREMCGSGAFSDILRAPLTLLNSREFDENRPGFPEEKHGVFIDNGKYKGIKAQYMGPSTRVQARLSRGDPGVNDVDMVAKAHDIDYMNASKIKDKTQRMSAIHDADKEFIKSISSTKDAPLTAAIAKKAIQLKMMAEKLGILSPTIFSGGLIIDQDLFHQMIKKFMSPAFLLKEELANKIKIKGKGAKLPGGIFPLLAAALPYLGTAGAAFIGEYLGSKLAGKGYNMFELLSKIPQTKQIDMFYDIIQKNGINNIFDMNKLKHVME